MSAISSYQEWREKVDPHKVTFAALISRWRWGGHMKPTTLTEFSEAYGIPLRTAHNWLSGERQPPEYVLMTLSFAMYCDGRLLYADVKRQDADFPM